MPDQQQIEFIVYCFLLRVVMAMGCAAADTASFAILSAKFPSHISSAFGLIEMACGVGQTLGPALGGFLTQVNYILILTVEIYNNIIVYYIRKISRHELWLCLC